MKRTWFRGFYPCCSPLSCSLSCSPPTSGPRDAEADPAYTEPFSQDPAPEAPQDAPLSVVGEVESLPAPRPRNTTASLTAATLR